LLPSILIPTACHSPHGPRAGGPIAPRDGGNNSFLPIALRKEPSPLAFQVTDIIVWNQTCDLHHFPCIGSGYEQLCKLLRNVLGRRVLCIEIGKVFNLCRGQQLHAILFRGVHFTKWGKNLGEKGACHQAKQRGRTKPNKGGAPSQTKGAHQAKQRGRTKPQAYKPGSGSNWLGEIRSTLRWMHLDGCNIAHLDSMLPSINQYSKLALIGISYQIPLPKNYRK
jgi:hypothetical protein